MNDWKKLGWISVVSIALFALAGCSPAAAEGRKPEEKKAEVQFVVNDQQPTSDAELDKGPGCDEASLAADNARD